MSATLGGLGRAPAEEVVAPLDPHLADALPAGERALVQQSLQAEAQRNYAEAYVQLSSVRASPRLSAQQVDDLDIHRDRLAALLAAHALLQAHRQMADKQWVYAQRFLLQALTYRAQAASELNQLWQERASREGLGAAAISEAVASVAHDTSPAGIRWRISTQVPSADWGANLRTLDDLEHLLTAAGSRDPDLRHWTRQLLASAPALHGTSNDQALGLRRLQALGTAIFGSTDPEVQMVGQLQARVQRRQAIAQLGPHPWVIAARLQVGLARLSGSAHASATPQAPSASFQDAAAGGSAGASGSEVGIDLRYLREDAAARPVTPFYGVALELQSAQGTLSLPVADADTGPNSLTGSHYQSRLGITALGLDVIAGVRIALGGVDGPWSLRLGAKLGLDHVHDEVGFRPGIVQGASGNSTLAASAWEPRVGIDAELAFRPAVSWSLVGAIGADYLRLPSISGTAPATFVDSTGTAIASGSAQTSLTGLRLETLWIGAGAQYTW